MLGSGCRAQLGVRALEDGGAMVHGWVPGDNSVSSALYTYTLDAAGKVFGAAKEVYDKSGAVAETIKTFK